MLRNIYYPTLRQSGLWLLALAVTLSGANPVAADVVIRGVSEGQVVRKQLELSATSDARRLQSLMIVLNGPGGTEIINRSGNDKVALMGGSDKAGRPVAWNSTAYPAGEYTVSAYSTEWTRSGRQLSTASINFKVENNNHAKAAPQPTPAAPAPPQSVRSESEESRPKAPSAGVQTLSPSLSVASSTLSFAPGTFLERTIGDDAVVKLRLKGDLTDGADVMIIVWDEGRGELVKSVSKVLTGGDLTIDAGLMDRLPTGRMELQAHLRRGGKITESAKHSIVNRAAPIVSVADGEMPTVSFPASVAKTHAIGSARGMAFNVEGAMPENGDVLVIAWSIDRAQLVAGFAQVLSEAPWEISASKLNQLPVGQVELQLRPRLDGQIVDKVVNRIAVNKTISAGLPEPETGSPKPTEGGAGTGGTPGETGGTGGGQTAGGDNHGGGNTTVPLPGNVGGSPSAPANVEINFASGTPSRYEHKSNAQITLDITGSLPAGADVLMLVWDKDRNKMVDGFAHELTGSPLRVNNARLDALPAGNLELQALLRIPGQPIKVRKQGLRIIDPDAPDEQTTDPGNGGNDPDYSGLTLSASGFTQFNKGGDTRVIYVAANGNDSNDGLSPGKPMKTAEAGFRKLRDGKPDWLLFKCGDTFRGNLGSIEKSGRSASEPMLIGTYGSGDRPVMLSPDNSWASKSFNSKGDNLAFVGLHLIAVNRDPTRSGFSANRLTKSQWNQSGLQILGDAKNILIEDCILEYFKFALVVQSHKDNGYARNIKIRRNAVINSYGHWDKEKAGHSSGLYAAYVDGMLLEDNVWFHNGWNEKVDGAIRTKFNHNIYVQYNSAGNNKITGNIIARGSAHGLQLRPGGEISNNLFVENPMAFFTGRHKSDVKYNVILKSTDMGKDADDIRGHGIEILPCLDARVENNIVSQKRGSATFAYAIGFSGESSNTEFLNGKPFKASLKNNKIYEWPRDDGRNPAIKFNERPKVLDESRNDLDRASGGDSNPPWIDPERDVESYMKSINKTASLDALIKAAVYRPRGQWAAEYSADAINRYVRRGFDVQPFD